MSWRSVVKGGLLAVALVLVSGCGASSEPSASDGWAQLTPTAESATPTSTASEEMIPTEDRVAIESLAADAFAATASGDLEAIGRLLEPECRGIIDDEKYSELASLFVRAWDGFHVESVEIRLVGSQRAEFRPLLRNADDDGPTTLPPTWSVAVRLGGRWYSACENVGIRLN